MQEVRRTTFINISAAAKPFIGLISSLGPEYVALGSQLLEQNVATVVAEHARRRAAGGAGPSGAPAEGGAAAADASAAAAAGTPLPRIQNPPDRLSRREQTRRHLTNKEAREAIDARRAARTAALGPHAAAIQAGMKVISVEQLKTALRAAGLPTTGRKAVLMLRLAEHRAGGGAGGAGGAGGVGGDDGRDGSGDDGDNNDSDSLSSDGADPPARASGAPGFLGNVLAYFGLQG